MAGISKERRMVIATIVKDLRLKAGLKQREVADAVSKSRSAYAYYESGSALPDAEVMEKLCNLYNVSMDVFKPSKATVCVEIPSYSDDFRSNISFDDLSPYEKTLLLKVRTLSKEDKVELIQHIDNL